MTLNNIKTWWFNLAERERKMLSVGGVVVGVLLFYTIIWGPSFSVVSMYETRVNTQRSLLQYLQAAKMQIQQYQTQGIQVVSTSHGNLLTTVEQSATQHHLTTFLKQVEQAQANHVTATFEKVPFDQCMEWLQELSMISGVRVISLSATRLSTPTGTADLTVTLG